MLAIYRCSRTIGSNGQSFHSWSAPDRSSFPTSAFPASRTVLSSFSTRSSFFALEAATNSAEAYLPGTPYSFNGSCVWPSADVFDVPRVSRLVFARFARSFSVQLSRARTCTSPAASAAALVAKFCAFSFVSRPFHNPSRGRCATTGPSVRARFPPIRRQASRPNVRAPFDRLSHLEHAARARQTRRQSSPHRDEECARMAHVAAVGRPRSSCTPSIQIHPNAKGKHDGPHGGAKVHLPSISCTQKEQMHRERCPVVCRCICGRSVSGWSRSIHGDGATRFRRSFATADDQSACLSAVFRSKAWNGPAWHSSGRAACRGSHDEASFDWHVPTPSTYERDESPSVAGLHVHVHSKRACRCDEEQEKYRRRRSDARLDRMPRT